MFKGRFIEFFEANSGRLSITRKLCYMSWWVSSGILIYNANNAEVLKELMPWYLGSFVLGYVGGKTTDIFMKKEKKDVVPNNTQSYS